MKCPLAALLLTVPPAFCQLAMPGWLVPYPGANAETRDFHAYLESAYTTSAAPAAVTEHYRKLFETAGLAFQPNSDGVGVNVRGAASECDLMISIRTQAAGTAVKVSCAEKSPEYTAAPGGAVVTTTSRVATSRTTPPRRTPATAPVQSHPLSADEIAARHQQFRDEIAAQHIQQDAPAPPLVWPDWLVDMHGTHPPLVSGVDRSRHQFLHAHYTSIQPMTAIRAFYLDLLRANGYSVGSSELGTGHTMSGIQQNAYGHVNGYNYPNGSPGPRTEIHIRFDRTHLNDPIEVDMRFTTFAFTAARRQF
jgi:hypothetical protein